MAHAYALSDAGLTWRCQNVIFLCETRPSQACLYILIVLHEKLFKSKLTPQKKTMSKNWILQGECADRMPDWLRKRFVLFPRTLETESTPAWALLSAPWAKRVSIVLWENPTVGLETKVFWNPEATQELTWPRALHLQEGVRALGPHVSPTPQGGQRWTRMSCFPGLCEKGATWLAWCFSDWEENQSAGL